MTEPEADPERDYRTISAYQVKKVIFVQVLFGSHDFSISGDY